MVSNDCKHDGFFELNYSTIEEVYRYTCVRCRVYHMNFDPRKFPSGVAYVLRNEGKTIYLSKEGKY